MTSEVTGSPAAAPRRVYHTILSESQVLDYFWAACRDGGDRLALLQQLSVVTVPTAPGWSPKTTRAAFVPRAYPSTGCFTCFRRDRRLAWHHIVAIDHGGGNGFWNTVAVCHVCHRRVHPWLTDEPDHGSWTSTDQLLSKIAFGYIPTQRPRRQVHDDDGRGRSMADMDEDAQYRRGEWK